MHSLYLIAAISLSGVTAGKVAGIIASVYTILQVIKKTFPAVNGYAALAINLGMSIGAVAVILPPEKLFSLDSLTALAIAGISALGSAGIHGTVQNVAPVALQAVLGQGPKVDATAVVESKDIPSVKATETKP
jgi:hypothetical protein